MGGSMDLATLLVFLLFKGGDTDHFSVPAQNMATCLHSLDSKKTIRRISGGDKTGYAIHGSCMPVSPRVFNVASRDTEKRRTDPCGTGNLRASTVARKDALVLRWTGKIKAPFYKRLAVEFEKAKKQVRMVLLTLSSCGGNRVEMERAIMLLRRIRKTHKLGTVVGRGDLCASACVPIFLQGQLRWGALTSSWMFHEVWRWADKERSNIKTNRAATERLFQDYFETAGVSESWLNRLRIMVQLSDFWQTGENLWSDKSGIITSPLGNHVPQGSKTYNSYSLPNRIALQKDGAADQDSSMEVLQSYVEKSAKKQSAYESLLGFASN